MQRAASSAHLFLGGGFGSIDPVWLVALEGIVAQVAQVAQVAARHTGSTIRVRADSS